MERLKRIDGVVYTQNAELPIEERVFFAEGLVADVNDYRRATADELREYRELRLREELI